MGRMAMMPAAFRCEAMRQQPLTSLPPSAEAGHSVVDFAMLRRHVLDKLAACSGSVALTAVEFQA